MKVLSIYFLSIILVISQSGFTKSKKEVVAMPPPAEQIPTVEPVLPLNDEEYYSKFVSEIKKSTRTTASTKIDVAALEQGFSTDFKTMRNELVGDGLKGSKTEKGVTNMNELDEVINKYSKPDEYAKLSPQAKFLALQLRALKPYKGFIFRAKRYIAGISATRTMIVTALRAQVAGIQTFFPVSATAPVNHWDVVFKYLTENVNNVGSEILDDQDLYNFFDSVSKENVFLLNDFAALFMTKEAKPLEGFKPIWWDNKLYMSFATFTGNDRYVALGFPEMFAIYSGITAAQSSLLSSTAYSFNGLRSAVQQTGKLFGVDNPVEAAAVAIDLGGASAQGMSSESRVSVLNRHPKLFAKTPECNDKMRNAYKYLVSSVKSAHLSYELTKKLPADAENLFDPRLAAGVSRIGDIAFYNAANLVAESTDSNYKADLKDKAPSAVILGKVIRVTLKNFYENPPEHLNELYPVDWEGGPIGKKVNVPGYSAKGQNVRNYKHGMAIEWNLKPYKKLFPDIKGDEARNRTKELPEYARILAQTWGSSVFAIPLGAAIF